jgi:hypothetical protein
MMDGFNSGFDGRKFLPNDAAVSATVCRHPIGEPSL